MATADRNGLPVAAGAGSAAPRENRFVPDLIRGCATPGRPERLVGDKAYDGDPLDRECEALGVTPIAPHRRNSTRPKTQDGRPLRRYKRRWKVERLFAWLQKYRRLINPVRIPCGKLPGFPQLAAFMILAKKIIR